MIKSNLKEDKLEGTQLTNKLKPVTDAKEVANDAPERANSPI